MDKTVLLQLTKKQYSFSWRLLIYLDLPFCILNIHICCFTALNTNWAICTKKQMPACIAPFLNDEQLLNINMNRNSLILNSDGF